MAHFPRWIENSSADSTAMSIGYMEWVRKERKNGRDPILLPEIRHYPYNALLDLITEPASGVDLPWLPCSTANCERCENKRGGFKFRWYSRQWNKIYMQCKRPGSWVPEGENNTSTMLRTPKLWKTG